MIILKIQKGIRLLFCTGILFGIMINISYSQIDSCGTLPVVEIETNSSFTGGIWKPHRTDIGGANPSTGYFPILVLFIQYQGESGGNFPGNPDSVNAWPAGRAPNYLDQVITATRLPNSASWWDTYNGYDLSDYWHEYSRGKLHAIGEAYSVILSHTKAWYGSGDTAWKKMNREVFDYMKDSTLIDWRFFDQWKTLSNGNFSNTKDGLVDMIYMVYRNRENGFLNGASGEASIGHIQGATGDDYTVYDVGDVVVKVRGGSFSPNCSGTRTDARGDLLYSRHKFLDVGTHEHGHYLLGYHDVYCHMTAGLGWEFSLSPWEVVKLGYIRPMVADYSHPVNYLRDYSSRYGYADSVGEVLQVPISDNGDEFFLLASRRKVSDWDRRMSGDTLAYDGYQALKNINPEYGKGLYIYHITNGYNSPYDGRTRDLECADGLWNWRQTGMYRHPIWNGSVSYPIFERTSPSYENDNPANTSSLSNRDEMSFQYNTGSDSTKVIWFSRGSADISASSRGTDRLYTNDEDYWFSLAVNGDRYDAWNVGYNEVFSPYSSPNTKSWANDTTGIFIYYSYSAGSYSESGPANAEYLNVYNTGEGGLGLDSILHLTPPSRPMG